MGKFCTFFSFQSQGFLRDKRKNLPHASLTQYVEQANFVQSEGTGGPFCQSFKAKQVYLYSSFCLKRQFKVLYIKKMLYKNYERVTLKKKFKEIN